MPTVSSRLTFADHAGAWKARWGIGRFSYLVPPGLYAVGSPDAGAPVVVTANYKMSYDLVRRALAGRNVWLLVLETFGINVWCAAGKGTFGTEELLRRVETVRLANVVSHRLLLLPVLGAPGVAAHLVKRFSGFQVCFATLRAADLPLFLDRGMKATPAMRELSFSWYDRLVLTPIELVAACRWAIPLTLVLAGVFGVARGRFAVPEMLAVAGGALGTVLSGAVVAPLALPLLPGRSFAVKGATVGALWAAVCYWAVRGELPRIGSLALFLIVPAITAFITLNFTGSTPFTSRSGVRKEMRLSMPVMAVALVCGVVCGVLSLLVGGGGQP